MAIQLNSEESILLLTSRPYLSAADDERLSGLIRSGQVEWPFVLWRSHDYRTTSMLQYHVNRLTLESSLPDDVQHYLESWAALSQAHLLTLYRELGSVLSALDHAGVDCYLTKGSALGPLYYPNPLARSMQDLDLMIHPDDAQRAQRAMLDLGYRHGLWNPGTNELESRDYRITPESLQYYHELPSLTKCVSMRSPVPKSLVPWSWRRKYIKCFIDDVGILTVPVFVDLHVNLSQGIELADVWRDAKHEQVLGRLVRVHSPTGMLWFIASRLYHEAFQYSTLKLSMFGDVSAILEKRGGDVDWTEVVAIGKKYGMHPGLYYVLSQIKNIARADVPDPVLDFLRPDARGIPSEHDWGDVLPKLLVQPVVREISLA